MGRRAKKIYYRDQLLYYTDGKTIIRVSKDTTNDLYVLFKNNKRITTKKKKKDIAEQFFQRVDKDKYVDLQSNIRPLATASEQDILNSLESGGEIEITIGEDGVATAADITKLTAADICKIFATIYYKDPVKAESLSGITYLSKLATMDFGFHSKSSDVTLDDLLNCYIQSVGDDGTIKKKNRTRYIRDGKNWWKEFTTLIEKQAGKRIRLLSDINKEHVLYYVTELCKVASQPKYKDKCSWLTTIQKRTIKPPYPKRSWIRHRKGKLIEILNTYISEHHLEKKEIEYKLIDNILEIVRKHKKLGKLATKPKAKPRALPVDIFQQLFNAGNLRWKTLLAFGVNCGFTFSELSDLEKQDLDLNKRELIQSRPKTGELRAAKLHPLTCQLMSEYNDKCNAQNTTIYFFQNKCGNQLNTGTMDQLFNELCKKAGVSTTNEFRQLRKCAATITTRKGCNESQVRLLMGHTLLGDSGAYVENSIEMVTPACEAVTEKYFAGLEK